MPEYSKNMRNPPAGKTVPMPGSDSTSEHLSEPEEVGGDSACWLHRLCPSCGGLYSAGEAHRAGCDAVDDVGTE
jgi:hypothetical protein